MTSHRKLWPSSSPLVSWGWWVMWYEAGLTGGVWICMWCGYVSTLTDLCTADWQARELQMSHLSRGGSLTRWTVTDGRRDGWVEGRKKGTVREKSPKKKKKSWGKGIWRGTEEEKRWKYEEILAREWQKEIEAGGQRSEGCRVRVPLVARVDVT